MSDAAFNPVGPRDVSERTVSFFRRHLALLLSLLFTALWGGFFIAADWLPFDSDMAVMALMGKHISQGREFPIFLYAQNYIGSLDAWLLAPVFTVLGTTVNAALFFTLLELLVVQVLVYTLAYRAAGRLAAGWAVWYLAIPSSYYVFRGFGGISGGYNLTNMLGLTSFLIGYSILTRHASQQPILGRIFGLGVALGLGFWTHPMIFYFAAPLFICLMWGAPSLILSVRHLSLFAGGFFLGSLPFWYYNLIMVPFGTLSQETILQVTGADVWVHRLSAFFKVGLPIIFAARQWGSVDDFFPGASIIGYGGVLVCIMGTVLSLNRVPRHPRFLHLLFLVYFCLMPMFFMLNYRSTLVIEPRYLFPLYAVFPVAFGIAASRLFAKHQVLGFLAATLIFSLNIVSLASTTPFGNRAKDNLICSLQENWSSGLCLGWWFARTQDELIPCLEENGIDAVYANYWIAYKLTFESQEKILAVPAGNMWLIRYGPHAVEVANEERTAFLFDLNEAQEVVRVLQQKDIPYKISTVSYSKTDRLIKPPDLMLVHNLHLPGGPPHEVDGKAFRIHLGSLLDRRHLLRGWSGDRADRISHEKGLWATGSQASLWVELSSNRAYRIRVRVSPYIEPDHAPQCLKASIDGIDLGEHRLNQGWNECAFNTPPLREQGSRQRTVLFSFCYSKSLAWGGCEPSEDSRPLSVLFDYIEFVPLPDSREAGRNEHQ